MIGGSSSSVAPRQAVAALSAALDDLINCVDDQLGLLGDDDLIGFLRDFEAVRNRMGVVDRHAITACNSADLAHRMQYRTTAELLVQVLHIEPREARQRVRHTKALHPRPTLSGEPLEPERPLLAQAVAAGQIPPGVTDRALRCLHDLETLPWVEAETVREVEETLVAEAPRFAPRDFAMVIDEISCAINPDGQLADDQIQQARRELFLWQGRDGMYHLQGRLTGWLGNQLKTLLDPLTRPLSEAVGGDDRTPGQRAHDALAEICGRLLRAGGLPEAGGVPATVIVTIDYRDLLNRSGYGRLGDGTPIAPETLLRLAAEADVIPTVLSAGGEVLSLGRSQRIASRVQTQALIARDRGCSFPGCDRGPTWCQRHHIIAWVDGGPTDVDNMTLVCLYHHANFNQQGWQCRMEHGVPEWIPPPWIDRERKPLTNYRITERLQPA